ncbi:prolyl oligopeptidase family serine peptidase [Sciscionella marina]|uniref:prolyl oligopeptidase family serine peptidase n=1 Tax=Sciscionella marina TaxID=508770 RepID=UPI0003663B1A|nr:prolyl oligopeptidase family serine peptidase [Sciscionella marina]
MQARPTLKTVGGVTFEDRFPHLQEDTKKALDWQWERDRLAHETALASPNYLPVRDRLSQLSDLPQGQAASATVPPRKRGRWWFERVKEDGDVLRASTEPGGQGHLVASARSFAAELGEPEAYAELFMFEASPNGSYVAVGWLVNGEQRGRLVAYATATGERLVEMSVILYTEARPGWLPDESGFWMNDRDDNGTHRLRFVPVADGAQKRDDVVLAGDLVPSIHGGLTPHISPDGRWAVAVAEPHEHVALVLLDLETLAVRPFVPEGWDGDCDGTWVDGGTYVARVNSVLSPGRIVEIPAETSQDVTTWRELVPESEGFVSWAGVVAGRIYVGDLVDVSVRIRVFDLDGNLLQTLPLENPGSTPSLNYERTIRPLTDVFTFTHETFTSSERVLLHDSETGDLREIRGTQHRLTGVVTESRFALSRDGVRVPYTMVHREDLDLSTPQPALVFAYGGFNTSFLPTFPTIFLPFIEAGGIFVLASLRGGGEYGRAWYDGGRCENKVNTFHDLEAIVETMIADGVTAADRTAFHGLSNGGMVAGAAVVFQPHLWRVVAPLVAIYDMMEVLPVVPETAWVRNIVSEDWGDPTNPEDARRIIGWSPYHNIADDVEYPAVFQVFGTVDSICRPFQGRKFTARIEEANAGTRPVHLRVWPNTGHEPAGGHEAEYTAEWLAFVMDQVGLIAKGPLS